MVSLGPFVPDCKLQVACGLPLSPDVDSEEQGPRPPGSVCIPLASLEQFPCAWFSVPVWGGPDSPSGKCHCRQPTVTWQPQNKC